MGTVARVTAYGKPGVIGTSVLVPIVSLSTDIQKELAENGHVSIPVPPDAVLDEDRMKRAGAPLMFRENIHTKNVILLDIGGFIKVTALGSPMWAGSLRSFPGLENSFIMQPTAGALGHLVAWTTMALRDNSLKADGFDNLFCSGHKSGPHICLMDAVVTGDLAGYNAARYGAGQNCLELPKNLIVGAFIDHVGKIMRTKEGLTRGWGILELEILKNLKVYKEDKDQAIKDVEKAGLKGIYQTKVC
jgi:folate-dependent tRNA-U54 methylase TrmFO/GidA